MHPAGKVAALSFEGRVISNLQSANIEFTMKRLREPIEADQS
jgi:hypothetical protein